jgi:FtsZ-binding cell division protein ZapB
MFCIPVHLWVSPILHDELGLVKDWLTHVEKSCDTLIETLPNKKVESCEHLIILGDMLEDFLVEQDKLSPKDTVNEFENHLKVINKEIRSRDLRIPHEMTSVLITVPGQVLPEEQQLITKLTWEIESCKQQSAELQKEIKTTKETIKEKKRKLEELRSEHNFWQKVASMQ